MPKAAKIAGSRWPGGPRSDLEHLIVAVGRTPGCRVKLVVVVDADHARCLRPDEDIERDTGRLESIDHPDPMSVARRIQVGIVGLDDAAG